MAKYYQLQEDLYADYGVQGYVKPDWVNDISFMKSKVIKVVLPLLHFEVNYPTGYTPGNLFGDAIPIVSQRFLQVLNNVGATNFQQFPVILNNPESNETWEGYHAWNIIGMAAAADLDKSDYDTIMQGDKNVPPLLAFNDITLRESKLPSLLLFRMMESPGVIIIHEKIVEELRKSNDKEKWGLDLIEVKMS